MAITQADVDNLEKALASGVMKTVYDGREVTFRSVTEIQAALTYAKGQLAAAGSGSLGYSLGTFSRD